MHRHSFAKSKTLSEIKQYVVIQNVKKIEKYNLRLLFLFYLNIKMLSFNIHYKNISIQIIFKLSLKPYPNMFEISKKLVKAYEY